MISNVFGQANAGKTNTKGMPGMLQLDGRSDKQRSSAAARRRTQLTKN
jgi:hypothetical protein